MMDRSCDSYVTLCFHCGEGWDGPGRCKCPSNRFVGMNSDGRRVSGPWCCFIDARQVNAPHAIGLGPWRGSAMANWYETHPEVW